MINGTSQDVPVEVPRGTKVTTADGQVIPLMYKMSRRDSGSYLRLERDRYYQLRFSYKGQQVTAVFESAFDAGWLLPDFLTFYGLIVDALTGAWYSFDGIAVHFPSDSLVNANNHPYIAAFEPKRRPQVGGLILGSAGLALPLAESELPVLLNFYTFGLGYGLSSKLTLLGEFSRGNYIDIMPRYTDYRTLTKYMSYAIGGRLKVQNTIYVSGGGGLTQITTSDLKYYDNFISSKTFSPVDKMMGMLYAGIGVSGEYGFMELRHTFGLSKIPLSNGEKGSYETTALGFGVNLHF